MGAPGGGPPKGHDVASHEHDPSIRYPENVHRNPPHHTHEGRDAGVPHNEYFEKQHKTGAEESDHGVGQEERNIANPSTEGGVPKKYPWTDRQLTVQEARRAVLASGKLAEEDRQNLFDHIHKLHPQILLERRRF